MSTKRNGLGRNLSALLSPSVTAVLAPEAGLQTLRIHQLQPGQYQPRCEFDEETLQELAQSIQNQGVLQPLLVRSIGEQRFEILAGERRWRASQLAGLEVVPVVVKTVSDEDARVIALVENLQRDDLNAIDQARAMGGLIEDCDWTHQQLAEALGKSRSAVSNLLRLLSLPALVQQFVASGELDMGHARALLGLEEALQLQLAKEIVEKKLSVRATEARVTRLKIGKVEKVAAAKAPLAGLDAHRDSLQRKLKSKVEIKVNSPAGAGCLLIHFSDLESLNQLMAQLDS